ncbi:MAG TPA: outer membrane protein assembly factor BamA [Candidatus Binatia bacterium]|nr:outer membrane protein assembly factor BamA [Candidatus Binatia bacterium]
MTARSPALRSALALLVVAQLNACAVGGGAVRHQRDLAAGGDPPATVRGPEPSALLASLVGPMPSIASAVADDAERERIGADDAGGDAAKDAEVASVPPPAEKPPRKPIDPARWLKSAPGLRSALPLLAIPAPLPEAVASADGPGEKTFVGRAPRVFGAAPTIGEIRIEGNQRVDQEAIRVHIKSRPGEPYDAEKVDQDLRAIYGMGFFEDVSVELEEPAAGGETLVFRVKERPFITAVRIEGGEAPKREDLESALKVRPRTIYDPEKVRRGIADAHRVFEEKGYLDAKIDPQLEPGAGPNEVELVYKIDEGEKIRITDIDFEGNERFSARELRGVMQTKEKGLFSFITGSGTLNREALKTDVERLTAYYYDNGYVAVKIDEPRVERKEDSLRVVIKIDEGDKYDFGNIDFAGDVPPPGPERDALFQQIEAVKGEVFRASILRDDVTKLTDFFGDEGYAFANVEPETLIRPEQKTVDVTFRVSKGKPVSIGQIQITGNTKTRDKVIRRELKVAEQEPFSATKLRRSRDALQRLGFFSDVNVTTRKGATEDQINLAVDVKEGSTGAFSAGAGYSSGDQFLFNVRISENNLFGRGQRIVLNADVGSIRRNIYLSFTEPYLLDTRLLGQVTLFNTELDYGDFTRDATGFALRALYPFEEVGLYNIGWLSLEDTSFGLEYRLERARIFDIRFDSPPAIFAEQGTTLISAVSPQLLRNTLNHAYDPTAGSFQELTFELAGLGGDEKYYLFQGRGRWYVPIYRVRDLGTFVYSVGGTVAYGRGEAGQSGKEIPLVQRFFPGGINTVRGYETRTLGPRQDSFDPQGNVINNKPIGGTNEFVLQNEIIFPILQSVGVKGVVFFDMGNAFLEAQGIDFGDLRYAIGAGIRWLSPFGPLRIEYGIPLNIKDDEKKSSILFSFGAPL